ncbi:uncharacterized protein LAJ45_01248 [Morchella importuna]|uniref:uncharacterized protein n=1 Tax=Morchella importuna TaxID=1174673 RepID=UPI001E8D0618|nr:uncharacterized protein LAJ45_01248 [Morchella importuna]KAH8154717.1 hypothetical protein LAJ45_01248 [Morchella importuna]
MTIFSTFLNSAFKPKFQRILLINAGLLFTITFFLLLNPLPPPTPLHLPAPPLQPQPPSPPPQQTYNASKLALLIEDRPIAHLAPLLLHMITVVPPDWQFLFLGSPASITHLNHSHAIRHQILLGKLALTLIPPRANVTGQEALSQTLTSAWFWKWLGGAERWQWEEQWVDDVDGEAGGRRAQVEWVLMFQSDSILCANSGVSLDEWLLYDWVGAPWNLKDAYGGNGGLSLRRVSRILQILRTQRRYAHHREMEDMWLVRRIGTLPGARMANGSTEAGFSVEGVWAEEPMGYHLGGSGAVMPLAVWMERERRERVWEWCPEIKMIMGMELENVPVEGPPRVKGEFLAWGSEVPGSVGGGRRGNDR